MNTTAIKCRITSKSSACTPTFGHYRGFNYSSNSCLVGLAGGADALPTAPYSLTSSPVLRQRSSTTTFSSWQLVTNS